MPLDMSSSPLSNTLGTPSNFWPMSVVAKRLYRLRCHLIGTEVGLGPGDFVFDGDPARPREKKHTHPTQFLAHVFCGQTAGWIKMPLGTEVDWVAAPPKKRTAPLGSWFMSIAAKRLDA